MKTLKEIANYNKLVSFEPTPKSLSLGDELNKHYDNKNLKQKLNPFEKRSLDNYIVGSRETNSYLWDKHKNSKIFDHDEELYVKTLDNILAKHKTPKGFNVWSGTIHNPEEIKDKNNIVHHPAYLSTSINHPTGFGFSDMRNFNKNYKHILKIHVPKDHPGLFVGGGEHEFILPRGTNLKHKFTKILKAKDKINNYEHNFKIHHMDIV